MSAKVEDLEPDVQEMCLAGATLVRAVYEYVWTVPDA